MTPAEFLNYYRRSAGGPAQLVGVPVDPACRQRPDRTLFKVLDTDKDGKLSKKELMAAENVLHKYDQNDDEVVTTAELLQTPAAFAPPGVHGAAVPAADAARDSPFVLVPRGGPERVTERLAVAKDLLARYDKDKDGKLIRRRSACPKRFSTATTPTRTALERVEVWCAGWSSHRPGGDGAAGRMGEQDSLLDLAPPAPREQGGAPALAVHKAAVNALSLGLNDAQISLIRAAAPARQPSPKTSFRATTSNSRRSTRTTKVHHKAAAGGRQQPGPVPGLPDHRPRRRRQADGGGIAGVGGAGGRVGRLRADDFRGGQRPRLFELLDVNNDGRLTLRELRGAWRGWRRTIVPATAPSAATDPAAVPADRPGIRRGPQRISAASCDGTAAGRSAAAAGASSGGRCGSARWMSTATATCRRASSSAVWRTSSASTRTATASSAWRRRRRSTR